MKTLGSLDAINTEHTLYLYYTVTLSIEDKIMGGIPKSPDVIENWIAFHLKDSHRLDQLAQRTADIIGLEKPTLDQAIQEHKEAMGTVLLTEEQIEEIKNYNWCGFHTNDRGLYIEGRQVKALFKEAANILRDQLGLTALKARIAERLFVLNRRIPLGVAAPHGSLESMVHAMTPQGPINALSRTDYVEQPTITFTVKMANQPYINKAKTIKYTPRAILETLLDYGQDLGLGANRSQGYGRFTYNVQEKPTP